jgi:hypothetical protein
LVEKVVLRGNVEQRFEELEQEDSGRLPLWQECRVL